MATAPSRTDLLLMSMAEVAQFAHVQRPVVTTWRRRYPDFPAPVRTRDGRPLFDGHAICSWLIDTGRAERDDIGLDLRTYALTPLVETFGAERLLAVATSLICMHHLDGQPLREASMDELIKRTMALDPGDRMLRSEIVDDIDVVTELTAVVDDLIEAAWGARPAFERVLTVTRRTGGAGHRLHPQLIRLMAELSGVTEHSERTGWVRIADPCAGQGDLLLASVDLVGEAHTPLVVAVEPDVALGRLLRRRMRVHDLPAEDISLHSRLDDDLPAANAIVTVLPYLPGEARSSTEILNVVDDLTLRLSAGGTAVVLGPAQALTAGLQRYSAEERLRTQLLTSGAVEAIVRLPGGMVLSRPGYDTALWVLTPSSDRRASGWMLLGDLSDRELTAEVVDTCVTDVVTWRRDGHRPSAHTRRFCIQTEISALLAPPQPLTPHPLPSVRERSVVLPETVARITQLEVTLARLVTHSADPINSGLVIAEESGSRQETIGALARRGWLQVGTGHRISDTHVTARGHHRVLGAADLRSPARSLMIDRVVLATEYPHATLSEPGDVLVSLTPEPAVHLDERGFSIVRFPVRRLRVTPEGRDHFPPRVLAALLDATIRGRPTGSVRPPRKLLDWQLSVLASQTAQRLEVLLAAITARRQRAKAELDALDELRQIAITGITNATLTFPR